MSNKSHFFYIFALMKRLLYTFFIYATLVFVTTSCGDDFFNFNNKEDEEEETVRTVLIYTVAENSLANFAETDRNELITASRQGSIPQNCRIVLYEDGTKLPRITIFSNSGYKIAKDFKQEQNSADRKVMLTMLQKMMALAPAKNYGLVLWSHGSGWDSKDDLHKTKGLKSAHPNAFGVDNGRNQADDKGVKYGMDITDVEWALAQLPHFDFLLWDACLMQCIEAAYQLKNHATWIIGSPIETPATGAPYSNIANALCTMDIENIMDQYRRYYTAGMDTYQLPLSAIKTSELAELARVTAPHITAHFQASLAGTSRYPSLSNAQIYLPGYMKSSDGSLYLSGMPRALDICSVMGQILSQSEYSKWLEQYKKTVPYTNYSASWYSSYATMSSGGNIFTSVGTCDELTDKEHYGAVSMFVPDDLYYQYYNIKPFFKQYTWYRDAGFEAAGW